MGLRRFRRDRWSAAADDGESGGARWRRGMAKVGDTKIANHVRQQRSVPPVRPKQPAIALLHHRDSGSDEPDSRVTKRRGLPRFGGDASRSEKGRRDGPVARPGLPAIKGSQAGGEPAQTLAGEGCRYACRSPGYMSPETDRRIRSEGGVLVERNDCGERLASAQWLGKPEAMLDAAFAEEDT